ncbi:PREDICTED: hyphally regulated cell wall protein 3 [Tarenaya hassleriana]|uniref:hyphally regulated cell wall protein 3 n=1 Tax=Tarenaya hassleriana TaxID=28532 RepID=UPI00053CA2C4|nr:PREDICTED: hyphally regulated cell wall protein 3 [Tarenaya hassleriana]
MAIARLLLPKPALHFSSRGFVLSTRRWSSSPSSPSDGRNDVLKSESSANKDSAQKNASWYSLGGILTNLKQKIVGNSYVAEKTSGLESGSTISANSAEVSTKECSSGDTSGVTTSEEVSSLKNSEQTKCEDSLTKTESSVSETASQSVTQCVSGIETSHETEKAIPLKAEQLDSCSDSSDLTNTKVSELESVEKLDLLEERRCENETSETGQTHQEKLPWAKIIEAWGNSKPVHKAKSSVMFEAMDDSSRTFTGKGKSHGSLSGDQDNRFGKMICDSLNPESSSKANDTPEQSGSLQKAKQLDCLLKGKNHDQMTGDLAISESKSTNLSESSGNTNMTVPGSGSGNENIMSINLVLDCIKRFPFDNDMGTEKDKSVSKDDSVSKESTNSQGRKEEETRAAPPSQATLAYSPNTKETEQSSYAFSSGEFAHKTVLVRFLTPESCKKHIHTAFNSCGHISGVKEVASVEGCIYRDAFVTFETKEAAQMALKKTDVLVNNRNVLVEATSQEDAAEEGRMQIPDVIGDPDVPIALVKEPTRTVKIQSLTHDISSNQIKEALGFCGCNISRFFLGSSSATAFVEFESEDGKERAIAEHSISVAGKKLTIFRIDVPRTTVLRFTNPCRSDLKATCTRYGQINKFAVRKPDVVDVYFKLSEWPNMLHILNSLNGKEMEGKKMKVRPAPVIPPDVLSILMKDPQGKRYANEVIHGLVRSLQHPLEVIPISTLVPKNLSVT